MRPLESGFLKGRSIHNNTGLVLDLLGYSDVIQESGSILFLDFYIFDSVEQKILEHPENFGFREKFLNTLIILYSGINSSVSLGHGTFPRFKVNRGIRQGCSYSPLLFILVAELLDIHI